MLVKQNKMTFDDADPRCQLFLGATLASQGIVPGHLQIAFITVVDNDTQMLKRYFGTYDQNAKEACIRQIMEVGGKWPDAFANKALPQNSVLSE